MSEKCYCIYDNDECPLIVNTIDGHEDPLYYCIAGVENDEGDRRFEEDYLTIEEALGAIDWLDDETRADYMEAVEDGEGNETTQYKSSITRVARPAACLEKFPKRAVSFTLPDIKRPPLSGKGRS